MMGIAATLARRWALVAGSASALVVALTAVAQVNFLLFHSIVEMFGTVVAFAIFAIAWHARRFCDSSFFLFLGTTFLTVGCLDMVHALAYKGMGVFPKNDPDLATRLWIVARYLEAVSCLVGTLLAGRGRIPAWVATAYVTTAPLIISLVLALDIMPVTYVPGIGPTVFKVASEYAVIALKASTAILVLYSPTLHANVRRPFLGYLMISAVAELAFTQYIGVYDLANAVGHSIRVLGLFLIYRATVRAALVEPHNLLFNNLRKAKAGLESLVSERTSELAVSNQALASANASLDALFAASPLAIVTVDRDHRISLWNAAAERLFHWQADEVIGKEVAAAFGRRDDEAFALAGVFAGKRADGLETRVARRDGVMIDIRLHSGPLADAQGHPRGVVALCSDIGEELQSREISREREERLRNIMDNVADAIITFDQEGRLESANAAAERMFGYGAGELPGRNLFELVPEVAGWLEAGAGDADPLQTSGSGPHQMTATRRDGRLATIDLLVDEMMSGSRRIFIGVARDVTARNQAEAEKAALERELMQAHKMEALGNLAGGIAHEVNNMLMPIIGLTDVTLKRAPAELRGNLEKVMAAAQRAREILSRVLAFSRTTAPQASPLRLAEVVREAVRLLAVALPPSIELRHAIKDEFVRVLGDPTGVHQIIINLVNNAVQAIGAEGGIVEIELYSQDAVSDRSLPGPCAVLRISDNGSGMDERTMSKIFEPFFTTKAVGAGTGMGLSVVHGIVTEWGGTISVESRPGQGATFIVRLPRHQEEGAAPPGAAPA